MKNKFTVGYIVLCVLWSFIKSSRTNEYTSGSHNDISAIVNITYKDPLSGEYKSEVDKTGRYGQSSPIESEKGFVVHVKDEKGKNDGCLTPLNVPSEHWIALIKRGTCTFEQKIKNAAITSNASAVVIYNVSKKHSEVPLMKHQSDVVAIAMSKEEGERIAALVDNGTKVWMEISVGSKNMEGSFNNNINKTSVLFVSISFIVLMIISLAWLVFYYIQRFRYAHAKERLSKRLMHAARKAIAKMSSRNLKAGDKETHPESDPCAVCIENYRSGEVVRTLPCGHIFHKSCVDPWLIEQRSCPMCKSDILKAYGLQIHSSLGSLVNLDLEAASTSIGPSELLPQSSMLHSDPGIVEVLYYPNMSDSNQRMPMAAGTENDSGNIPNEAGDVHHHAREAEEEEVEDCRLPEEQQSLLSEEHSHPEAGVKIENKRRSGSLGKVSGELKAEERRKQEHDRSHMTEEDDVCQGLLEGEDHIDSSDGRSEALLEQGSNKPWNTTSSKCDADDNDDDETDSGALVMEKNNVTMVTMDKGDGEGTQEDGQLCDDAEKMMAECGDSGRSNEEFPTQGTLSETVPVKNVTEDHSTL